MTSITPAAAFAPRIRSGGARAAVDAEWAIAGSVAAILGLAIGFVFFVCSVCQARSFRACMAAVKNWLGGGC